MPASPDPRMVQRPTGLGALWNNLTGTENIGRGAPQMVDGQLRTPTYDSDNNFRGWAIPNGEDRARFPDINDKEQKARLQQTKSELIGEQRRQEGRSDERFELLYRQGLADRQSAEARYYAGLEADREARREDNQLRSQQISNALKIAQESNNLTGQAQLFQADNNRELNAISREQMEYNRQLAQDQLAMRGKELGAQRKMNLLSLAVQMMSGRA